MKSAARAIVTTNLNIKPYEKVLVVTDTKLMRIGQLIFDAAREVSVHTLLAAMEPTGRHGAEPPDEIAKLMKSSDVVIAPTYFSLTHTKARRDACDAGTRVATMPRVQAVSFTKGALTADYNEVKKLCEKMHAAIRDKTILRIRSQKGTDVTMEIGRHRFDKDTGVLHNKGDFGNLPAGEVDTAPNERTTNGRIVFDFFSDFGKNVEITVQDGYVQSVKNSSELEKVFSELGKKAKNIAEIGIGCNPKALLIKNVLEYEKILGTIHIALGNNMSYGGRIDVPFHEDGVILEPTLIADGKVLIQNGKWRI